MSPSPLPDEPLVGGFDVGRSSAYVESQGSLVW